MSQRQPRVVYVQALDGQWVFEVVGANGEVQMRSERYVSKANAERGLADLKHSLDLIEVK